MPVVANLSVLEEQLNNMSLIEITDPYFKIKEETELTKTDIRKRNSAWEVIEKYWEAHKPEVLSKDTRSQVFETIARSENMPVIKIKRIFSRFWSRGMSRNSLLPDYSNSGGEGRPKVFQDKKNGRKRIHSDSEGIVITDTIKRQFEIVLKKYWRTTKKKSLRQVYRFMLADFYSITVRNDSELQKIIQQNDYLPTFEQFYYWYKTNKDTALDIKSREGENEFNLKHRPIQSNSTLEAPGPGFRFQIDATPADIYIVSGVNRSKVIGRPIVYLVIDVFSRMIVGINVGLENPSWNGAMMALDSMVVDKTELCKKFNIDIEPEDWPCTYIPQGIIADRGEMEGHGVENLINNLGVTIENTSPYRGDFKGIVERYFRTMNERIESLLPGAVMKDYRKRGDSDYRLEAKLTLKEITEVAIRGVLLHNIREIEDYPMTPELIRYGVKPVPLELWNWGIANKKGTLRKIDRDIFRMNILPRGKATFSRGALIFSTLRYGGSQLLDERLYKRTKLRSLPIVFDPRNVGHIYWLKEGGREYTTFNLLDMCQDYKHMYLEDVIAANDQANALRKQARNSQLQQEVDLDQSIINIGKNAERDTNSVIQPGESKYKRIKDIKENRTEELKMNRQSDAFVPDMPHNQTPVLSFPNGAGNETASDNSETESLDYNARLMEKIRQRKEALKRGKS
jgi:hypothetical protein